MRHLGLPALLLLLLTTTASAKGRARDYRPIRVADPQPVRTAESVIPASEVKKQVTDGEIVLGITINGRSRAYPINMLTGPKREIINDRLGNTAIAATW